MHRAALGAALVLALAVSGTATAAADREPFPHDFHRNMGYCAPYLASLRLPDGSAVRPFINHTIQDLTRAGTFEGQENLGDLYSDRARSTDDQQCLPRR